ncbi:MAG: DUF4282 domain-containing protein [Gammaproteobacteria bacterium]|nr:DUF4282 domain-containing protein [Gammaproteobacteria bacterium]
MQDFIQFKVFIAQDILTVFYIVMAIVLPVICWFWLSWIVRRYEIVIKFYKEAKRSLVVTFIIWIIRRINFFQNKIEQKLSWESLSISQKLKFIAIFLFIVVFSELFLRLMFEYLIAYMQMHEWMNPINNN